MSSWLSRKVSEVLFVLSRCSSRIVSQGMKSIIELGLSGAINLFAPKPAFYVQRSLGRGPFFEQDKSKQDLRGEHGLAVGSVHTGISSKHSAGQDGIQSKKNLNRIKHYTIRGFNPAGKMVFTAELADRVVDSEAWVYEANKMGITFKGNEYRRVCPPVSCQADDGVHGLKI
ncbi:hypothetical protein EV421DRAFT_1745117 [Armillaria borealis]|uniref:Uncharacterized protein n=1 Tax=Armillaria borealis TaxID=47425 RepID=A0AA39IU51_9AGAR|nr:hypothetical protein EV421DRAFT_1745117 [Armillaria borealis]